MCTTCALIPENGIKTHKCKISNKIYKINTPVTCTTENVVYRITCKKPKCEDFVYIGETKRRFCDRFSEHKSYVTSKKLEQACGSHFNKQGHNILNSSYNQQHSPQSCPLWRRRGTESWLRRWRPGKGNWRSRLYRWCNSPSIRRAMRPG